MYKTTCEFVVTVVLIFDGEAEDVASSEAGAVIHAAVEERMGVGVLNVQNLTSGGDVARDALIGWDTELILRLHRHTQAVTGLVTNPAYTVNKDLHFKMCLFLLNS